MDQKWIKMLLGEYQPYPFTKLDIITGGIIFLVSLTVYTFTLTPSVSAGDNGELTSAIFFLGLGHAPGYPIHSLFGKIFTFIPINNIGWRANFYSAFSGSLAIFFSYLTYLKLVNSLTSYRLYGYLSAIIGALAFCFSTVLWSQSITTEVYAISSIFYPLLTLIVLKWFDEIYSRQGSTIPYFGENYLLSFAFVLGVGLGGHQTLSITEFYFGLFVGFGLLIFQILPRKDFEKYFTTGIWHFLGVIVILTIAWYYYIARIVSLKSNLFYNNYANLKSGVWAFVICNLTLLTYYLIYKYIISRNPGVVDPRNSFQRLAFFTVKFFGMMYLGLFVYFYLFIRSHGSPPINWGGIDQSTDLWGKIAKFFTMINRKQFAPNTIDLTSSTLYYQLGIFIQRNLFQQFTLPLWGLIFLGLLQLFRKCRVYLIWFTLGFLTFTIQLVLYINYDVNTVDLFFVEVFFIFSYFMLSIFIPFGILFLLEGIEALINRVSFSEINMKNSGVQS